MAVDMNTYVDALNTAYGVDKTVQIKLVNR